MSNHIPHLTQPELTKLDGCIREAVDSKIRVESETSLQKDIAARVKEEFGLSAKHFNQIVGERYENKVSTDVSNKEEVLDFYETIETAARNAQDRT